MKYFTLIFNQEELLLTLEALRNYDGHGLTKRQYIAGAIEKQMTRSYPVGKLNALVPEEDT